MGRYLAIDFGQKRIGLALSDPLKIIAKPFKTILYNDIQNLLNEIIIEISDNDIEKIILGYPIGMKGQITEQTKKVIDFSELLKSITDIPVLFQDERLSSAAAKKALITQKVKTGHNKDEIDSTAAAIFLQNYLDKFISNEFTEL